MSFTKRKTSDREAAKTPDTKSKRQKRSETKRADDLQKCMLKQVGALQAKIRDLKRENKRLLSQLNQVTANTAVTAIVTNVEPETGHDIRVEIYYTGTGSADAWKEACHTALENETSVVRVTQSEPLTDSGSSFMFGHECLDPNYDRSRMESIAGVDDDSDDD